MKKMIDVGELADLLSVQVGTIYTWCWQKKIPYTKLGNKALRFSEEQVNQIIEGWSGSGRKISKGDTEND